MKIISRAEAKKLGLTSYFTGKPCPRGHVAERRVINRACTACAKDWQQADRDAHPEKHRAKNQRWVKANPDKIKVSRKARSRRWREKNPEKARHKFKQYIWRLRGAEGSYTVDDLEEINKNQHNTCVCGVSFDFVNPTVDHIVALARGGSNNPENIQLLCQPCNDSKGVLSMPEWTPQWAANLEAIGD